MHGEVLKKGLKPMSTPLPNIGKVAKKALANIDIHTLEALTTIHEDTLAKLHGVGPKAMSVLKETLAENKLTFMDKLDVTYKTEFAVVGHLSCDNAPKRRFIRDFMIACMMPSQAHILENIIEDFQLEIVGEEIVYSSHQLVEVIKAKQWRLSSLKFETILSHGKEGAASATVILTNGELIKLAGFFNFQTHRKDALIEGGQLFVVRCEQDDS